MVSLITSVLCLLVSAVGCFSGVVSVVGCAVDGKGRYSRGGDGRLVRAHITVVSGDGEPFIMMSI